MKKPFLLLGILPVFLLTLGSCSGDDNPATPGPTANKNIKFTFSTAGLNLAEGDRVSFNLAGSNGTANTTFWKVNGVTRSNEQGFIIDEEDLAAGSTFVVESVTPLFTASISISAQNFGATTYKLNYKAEVNGTEQNTTNIDIITSGGYLKQYTY